MLASSYETRIWLDLQKKINIYKFQDFMRFNRNPYVWVSPATITPRELFPKPDKPNAVFLMFF